MAEMDDAALASWHKRRRRSERAARKHAARTGQQPQPLRHVPAAHQQETAMVKLAAEVITASKRERSLDRSEAHREWSHLCEVFGYRGTFERYLLGAAPHLLSTRELAALEVEEAVASGHNPDLLRRRPTPPMQPQTGTLTKWH